MRGSKSPLEESFAQTKQTFVPEEEAIICEKFNSIK